MKRVTWHYWHRGRHHRLARQNPWSDLWPDQNDRYKDRQMSKSARLFWEHGNNKAFFWTLVILSVTYYA